ncbi:MAG: alpha/beta fold hydrolase [Desulfurivibrio sp.]|nr:MAG: alpha/beta fold hydrolase [Desulfurivibrio sp.]
MTAQREMIVLVHGFFRTRRDMAFLAGYCEKRGYLTFRPTLPAFFSSLEQCTAGFAKKLQQLPRDFQRIHFVGHSMGGLIIRQYLAGHEVAGLGRCVLIGTPNSGTHLAGIAEKHFGLALKIFKPVQSMLPGRLLIGPPRNQPPPEIGVIAGNRSTVLLGRFFTTASDGRVAVDAVPLTGQKDFIVLPYNHLQIHHRQEVAALVLQFIRTGGF